MEPKIYFASDHELASENIDPDALYVVAKLKEAGFIAYLVGGSVRDLLAQKKPKDYDISTSALPEQIKSIFKRNCLLIGRRFRLAHIRFGKKIIEVATFRSGENDSDLITNDNQWGNPEEDAMRRDFTINGLFYDPETHSIIDYVGGWDDIHKGIIRTIGEPDARFKQDPVRMIRLLKFRARFGFEIDPGTYQSLLNCQEEIIKSSPARILEEMLRMLESGYATQFLQFMSKYGLLSLIFPILTHFLEGDLGDTVYQYLKTADKINLESDITLDRSVLVACLLFPIFEEALNNQFLKHGITPHLGEITLLSAAVIKDVVTSSFSHFPRRLSSMVTFVLSTQYRLTPLNGKKFFRSKLLRNHEFPHAMRFLQLRSLIDPELAEVYQQWKKAYRQTEHHGDRTPHPHEPHRHHEAREPNHVS